MKLANINYIMDNDYCSKERKIWIMNRVMCGVYVGICCWIIFNPLEAIRKSPSIVFNNLSYGQEYASCDNFSNAIASWPSVLLLLFSAMDKVVVMAPMSVILRDFFLGPIFMTVFWFLIAYVMLTIYISSADSS
jgi:hypothetical protein